MLSSNLKEDFPSFNPNLGKLRDCGLVAFVSLYFRRFSLKPVSVYLSKFVFVSGASNLCRVNFKGFRSQVFLSLTGYQSCSVWKTQAGFQPKKEQSHLLPSDSGSRTSKHNPKSLICMVNETCFKCSEKSQALSQRSLNLSENQRALLGSCWRHNANVGKVLMIMYGPRKQGQGKKLARKTKADLLF